MMLTSWNSHYSLHVSAPQEKAPHEAGQMEQGPGRVIDEMSGNRRLQGLRLFGPYRLMFGTRFVADRAHPHRGKGLGREADRTSIEAQVIPMLCKCLRAVGSVARHATCLGQAEPLADEVFM
jgi:hypothetical protein